MTEELLNQLRPGGNRATFGDFEVERVSSSQWQLFWAADGKMIAQNTAKLIVQRAEVELAVLVLRRTPYGAAPLAVVQTGLALVWPDHMPEKALQAFETLLTIFLQGGTSPAIVQRVIDETRSLQKHFQA